MTRSLGGSIGPAGAVAWILAALGLLVLVLVLRPRPLPESPPIVSSRQCADCHAEAAAEWRESHHALAYENPEVRKLSQDFQNEECLACHAPRPVLSFAPGERVLERASDRALGVDCLACHGLVEGGVATADPAPDPRAPCRPRLEPRMADVQHCAACHNQHGTVDQWREAPQEWEGRAFRGANCLHCHMPEAPRASGRPGRDHRFLSAHDLPSLQAAARLEAAWDASGPWAAVTNSGAAHNFPTDERSRAADVQARWELPDGWSPWERVHRFRDPYRDEVDLTNTQLPAAATWRQALQPPDGARGGEVRLLYRTNPFQPDAEAAEVARVRIAP